MLGISPEQQESGNAKDALRKKEATQKMLFASVKDTDSKSRQVERRSSVRRTSTSFGWTEGKVKAWDVLGFRLSHYISKKEVKERYKQISVLKKQHRW